MGSKTSRVLAAGIVAAGLLAGLEAGSAGAAEGKTIQIVQPRDPKTWGFDPPDVTVAAGTTVTWKNEGRDVHDITSKEHDWGSPDLRPGESWSKKFQSAGVYAYNCSPHPWMRATIRVE